jgi:hypothetical protein
MAALSLEPDEVQQTANKLLTRTPETKGGTGLNSVPLSTNSGPQDPSGGLAPS